MFNAEPFNDLPNKGINKFNFLL